MNSLKCLVSENNNSHCMFSIRMFLLIPLSVPKFILRIFLLASILIKISDNNLKKYTT